MVFAGVSSLQNIEAMGDLLEEINKGTLKPHGDLWYCSGKFLYVTCAAILCCVALFMKVAF